MTAEEEQNIEEIGEQEFSEDDAEEEIEQEVESLEARQKRYKTPVRSVYPFSIQEFEIMSAVRMRVHENMYKVRCGDISYICRAYAALEEYYITFLRPMLIQPEIDKYDAGFEDVFNRILASQPTDASDALKELEKELMTERQFKNIGILVERADSAKGVMSYLTDNQRVTAD